MKNVSGVRTLVLLLALSVAASSAKTLDIYFVDVEGGQATLIVAPSGQSLLVDTGYAGNSGRDANRIAAAAKAAGVKKIDYLLITHFHADHVGGVANLLDRLPVTTFLDHGPSMELDGKYPEPYEMAFAKGQHKVIAPGEKIALKGLDVTVVAAAGKAIEAKGEPNSYCAGLKPHAEGGDREGGENTQSAAIVVQYGKFRFFDPGDLTYNKQYGLLCPDNRVGKVDLYLTAHHGQETLNAIWALAPRVAIETNGARKGGFPEDWKIVRGSPGLEDIWQLHFALAGGKDANAPDALIANLDSESDGNYLKVSAAEDGSFTVFNQRNKYARQYGAR
jgi:competence protein ComEC